MQQNIAVFCDFDVTCTTHEPKTEVSRIITLQTWNILIKCEFYDESVINNVGPNI